MTLIYLELALAILIVLTVAMTLWYFSSSTRTGEKRRADLESRRLAQQPWDADGASERTNR